MRGRASSCVIIPLTQRSLSFHQSFLDVVIELEMLDMVSSQRVDLVEDCLKSIGRRDLAKKVSAYKNSGRANVVVYSQGYLECMENPQPQSCMK